MSSELTKHDSQTALEELFEEQEVSHDSYMILRQQLIKFFVYRRCEADAEDLASEVMERLLENLIYRSVAVEKSKLLPYVYGVARNVFKEHIRSTRHLSQRESILNVIQLADAREIEANEHEEKLQTLDQCLRELRESDVDLIISYYIDRDRDKLASELGISKNNLWVKVSRIRHDLRQSFKRKMKAS